MAKIWVYFRSVLAAVFLVVIAIGGWLWWSWQPVSSADTATAVIISPGMPLAAISQQLEDKKLVHSKVSFQILVHLLGLQGQLQAGKFILTPKMAAAEVARTLTRGRLDIWLRVKEGWRREQIADLLVKDFHLNGFRFMALTENSEGMLFPDSYLVPPYFNERQVAGLLTRTFRQKTADLWVGTSGEKLKQRQTLILASLVEREAKFAVDRPLVAAVLLNRWRAGWPLQVDATVQYAKANADCRERLKCNWWPKVGRQDLKMASPYNTYLHRGLPPGPICNPSLAAIKAVIQAPKTDNWYYVSDGSGHLHFAKTLKNHQANIQRYLK